MTQLVNENKKKTGTLPFRLLLIAAGAGILLKLFVPAVSSTIALCCLSAFADTNYLDHFESRRQAEKKEGSLRRGACGRGDYFFFFAD